MCMCVCACRYVNLCVCTLRLGMEAMALDSQVGGLKHKNYLTKTPQRKGSAPL